jgi:TPR repeat protein
LPPHFLQFYILGAELGSYAPALNNAAFFFLRGLGGPKDSAQAIKYFQRAALLGCPTAAFNYAQCLEFGVGVAENAAEALDWYKTAAMAGDVEAEKRLEILYVLYPNAKLSDVESDSESTGKVSFHPPGMSPGLSS